MESAHRYRLLIIFAALVFCLTVCFANAETTRATLADSGTQASASSRMHDGFLAPLPQGIIAIPDANQATTLATPVVSQKVLNQLTNGAQKSHGFWHGISLARPRPALVMHHQSDNPDREPAAGTVQGANAAVTSQDNQTE